VEEEGRYEVDSWQLVPEVWMDLEELGIAFEEGNRNLDNNDACLVEVDEYLEEVRSESDRQVEVLS